MSLRPFWYSTVAFHLAIVVFHCHNSTAPEYQARDLQWAVDDGGRKIVPVMYICLSRTENNTELQPICT